MCSFILSSVDWFLSLPDDFTSLENNLNCYRSSSDWLIGWLVGWLVDPSLRNHGSLVQRPRPESGSEKAARWTEKSALTRSEKRKKERKQEGNSVIRLKRPRPFGFDI